ncbi:MAG: 4Fe-4S binding protein [Chitinispirillales bacterium]|jgi:electron transport complex protein RnfB|nr:4Fe-4S binding protein [Chitinispirillales bacterium]
MKKQSEDSNEKKTEVTGNPQIPVNRREFLKTAGRFLALSVLGAGLLKFVKLKSPVTVWQIDPRKCIHCGRCATECVLNPSAVRCVHAYEACGYCKLCGGYYRPNASQLNTAAESQLCPTGAIKRTFIEDPYFKYQIDEDLCNGCGKCVKGCASFGNGSLYLQVRHHICVGCNECRIATRCPAQAISLVTTDQAYWKES